MARSGPAAFMYPATIALACLACLSNIAAARAEDPVPSPPEPGQKLQLTLTEAELEAVIRRYQASMGFTSESFLEEVTVKAPLAPLNMRDPTRDVWGGIAAPFWAVMHPAQSWRILMPIPPEPGAENP